MSLPFRALFFCLAASLSVASAAAQAAPEADDLVRLPGDGDVKADADGKLPERLVPGGGLILSFDRDKDGRINLVELKAGAAAAFAGADANADGALTAIEQIVWAKGLPSHDDTLANPVRFDPNLDRQVSETEFVTVILKLANAYMDQGAGSIALARLEAKTPPEDDRARNFRLPDFSGSRREE